MLLIKNATVYAPEFLVKKEILMGGNTLPGFSDRVNLAQGIDIEEVDANGLMDLFFI